MSFHAPLPLLFARLVLAAVITVPATATAQGRCDLAPFIAKYQHLAPQDSLVLRVDSLDDPLQERVHGRMVMRPQYLDWNGSFWLAALVNSRGEVVVAERVYAEAASTDSSSRGRDAQQVPGSLLKDDLTWVRTTKYYPPRRHDFPVWVFFCREFRHSPVK